jgi:hypothetical protein
MPSGFFGPSKSVRFVVGPFGVNCLGGGIDGLGFDDNGSGAGVWPKALPTTKLAAATDVSKADVRVALFLSPLEIHAINKTFLAF